MNSEIYKYFFNNEYQKHNVARLQHLESLKLNLDNKTILEFGAGVGDHTIFYLFKNCQVFPTDARKELVDFIKERLGVVGETIDAERDFEKIKLLPKFDAIHCYGILYHLNNPEQFLDSIKDKADLLLLETCVSGDDKLEGIHLVDEPIDNLSQSFSGKGSRPTRNWVMNKLRNNYKYVYLPKTQPKHTEFPMDWNVNFPEEILIRCVFIASNKELNSDKLSMYILKKYNKW